MANGKLPASTTVGRVALRVADSDRVVDFYESVVGLAPLETGDDTTVLGAGGDPLLIVESHPGVAERTQNEAGLFHVAIRVPTREALGDALERIDENWQLDGASDHRVSEALYLRDPAGNGVEIYWDKPQEAWPVDVDGGVRMTTDPLDVEALNASATSATSAPPATTVGHVHLEVTDLNSARTFYVDTLGLSVRQTYGDSALFLAAGDYHHHVGLNTWNGRTAPQTGQGMDWFELVVPEKTSVDDVTARCERNGYDVTNLDAGIAVVDGDGLTVLVVHS